MKIEEIKSLNDIKTLKEQVTNKLIELDGRLKALEEANKEKLLNETEYKKELDTINGLKREELEKNNKLIELENAFNSVYTNLMAIRNLREITPTDEQKRIDNEEEINTREIEVKKYRKLLTPALESAIRSAINEDIKEKEILNEKTKSNSVKSESLADNQIATLERDAASLIAEMKEIREKIDAIEDIEEIKRLKIELQEKTEELDKIFSILTTPFAEEIRKLYRDETIDEKEKLNKDGLSPEALNDFNRKGKELEELRDELKELEKQRKDSIIRFKKIFNEERINQEQNGPFDNETIEKNFAYYMSLKEAEDVKLKGITKQIKSIHNKIKKLEREQKEIRNYSLEAASLEISYVEYMKIVQVLERNKHHLLTKLYEKKGLGNIIHKRGGRTKEERKLLMEARNEIFREIIKYQQKSKELKSVKEIINILLEDNLQTVVRAEKASPIKISQEQKEAIEQNLGIIINGDVYITGDVNITINNGIVNPGIRPVPQSNTPEADVVIENPRPNTPVPTGPNNPVPTGPDKPTKPNNPAPTGPNKPIQIFTNTSAKPNNPTPPGPEKPTKPNNPAPTGLNTPVPTGPDKPTKPNNPVPTGPDKPTKPNNPVPTGPNNPIPIGTNKPTKTNTPVPTGPNTPVPTGPNTPVPTGPNRTTEPAQEPTKRGIREIIKDIRKDYQIGKSDGQKYARAHLNVTKTFLNEINSGNYLYNIVHIVPGLVKAGVSLISKVSSILFSGKHINELMDNMRKNIDALSDSDLEVLWNEFRGNFIIQERYPKALVMVIQEKMHEYALGKVEALNVEITNAYRQVFAGKTMVDALNKKLKSKKLTKEEREKLKTQKEKILKAAVSNIDLIKEKRVQANEILSGGLHGMDEDIRARESKMNYTGYMFAKEHNLDVELEDRLTAYEKAERIARETGDDQGVLDEFLHQELLLEENTKISNTVLGKLTTGKKQHSPLAEALNYSQNPFIRDLLTTCAIAGVTWHAIGSTLARKAAQEQVARADAANAQITQNVQAQGRELVAQSATFRKGMRAQSNEDVLAASNSLERQALDQSSIESGHWMGGNYTSYDEANHSFFDSMNTSTQQVLSDISRRVAGGQLSQTDALKEMVQLQQQTQGQLTDVLEKCYNTLLQYRQIKPQFALDAPEMTMRYLINHANSINDMNQAMLNSVQIGEELLGESAELVGKLPSDLLSSLAVCSSSALLAYKVSSTMSAKYGDNKYHKNAVTDMFEDYAKETNEAEETKGKSR